MKYRGDFDMDACERQFDRQRARESHQMGRVSFDIHDAKVSNPRKRFKGRKRERAREQRPWRDQ